MTLVSVCRALLGQEDDEVDHILQSSLCKMFGQGRLLCFLLAVLFTIVAVITNSQNYTRQVPVSKPFFNRSPWVEDFYEGELYLALLKATKYDVIFLMLYAPWDADCQFARTDFENTCKFFHKKVYCAAINCWQTNAGCKAFFDNIVMYPIFFVDLHHLPSIRYQGEISAPHMIRFLSHLIEPLHRIHSLSEFDNLKSVCDATIISYFSDYEFYKRYYVASVRMLEFDPRRELCWAITTDKSVASLLNVDKSSVVLHSWNETVTLQKLLTSSNIVKFVRKNIRMLTRWIFFENIKSDSLSKLVHHNPAVILFTPNPMYLDYVQTYSLFKEAVMDYEKCSSKMHFHDTQSSFVKSREKMIMESELWQHVCYAKYTVKKHIFNSQIVGVLNEFKRIQNDFSIFSSSNSTFSSLLNRVTNFSSSQHRLYENNSDERAALNLVLQYVQDKCKIVRVMLQYSKPPRFINFGLQMKTKENNSYLKELCSLNRTFSYFAVDSILYSHFSRALGVDLKKYEHLTAVAILDHQNEETFLMERDFNSKHILHEFMFKSSKHLASRWKKSSISSMYLHRYNKTSNIAPCEISLPELDSESFESVVFNKSQHVFVYFHSPYCSYCQVRANSFLYVAYTMRNYSNIKFVRVDGENNDLPWHLVPLSYPTIMSFPAERKSDSIVYPPSRELTTENLLQFVLSSIEPETKLDYMLDNCIRIYNPGGVCKRSSEFTRCIQNVENESLVAINNLVSKYKKISNGVFAYSNKTILLESVLNRLRHLRSFYFQLNKTLAG